MQNCISASADTAAIVPNKRVNYAFGMVLGVSDFVQEQEHFQWKARLANRMPHGYGRLCGMSVSMEAVASGGATTDQRIKIEPGYAISPRGNWLRLETELCAQLIAWVTKNPPTAPPPEGGTATVYVQLCYVECSTDAVPIAANSCASSADSTAPSRILETVAADFSWTSPDEGAVFGTAKYATTLAAQSDIDTIHTDIADWATTLRAGVSTTGCLPPPQTADCLLLAQVTFSFAADGKTVDLSTVALVQDTGSVLADTRLLQEWLAALQASVIKTGDTAGGDLSGTYPDPTVVGIQGNKVEAGLPTDQEALIWSAADKQWEPQPIPIPPNVIKDGDAAGGDLSGTYPNPAVAQIQGHKVGTEVPADTQVLTWSGTDGQWEPKAIPFPTNVIKDGDAAGGDLSGTYPGPTVAQIQGHKVGTEVPADTQVLTWSGTDGQWEPKAIPFPTNVIKIGDAASGDLSGAYPGPTVAQIQGHKVGTEVPADTQVLTWSGADGQWEPKAISIPPVLPFSTVVVSGTASLTIWFHVAPGTNNGYAIQTPTSAAVLKVYAEIATGSFLSPVASAVPAPGAQRNVWTVALTLTQAERSSLAKTGSLLLRLVFNLAGITAIKAPSTTAVALQDLMSTIPVLWEGYDSATKTVTQFATIVAAT